MSPHEHFHISAICNCRNIPSVVTDSICVALESHTKMVQLVVDILDVKILHHQLDFTCFSDGTTVEIRLCKGECLIPERL